MEVVLAVLADAANVSREGKLNILGEFNSIWAGEMPVTWPMMCLVIKLEATAGEGPRHKLGVRVVDEDGRLAAPPIDGEVDFGPPFMPGLPHRSQFIIGIQGAVFKHHGAYAFEILVDGHHARSVPLYVNQPLNKGPSA